MHVAARTPATLACITQPVLSARANLKATFTKLPWTTNTAIPRHHPSVHDTMRWLQLFTASLLPFTALAAKKSTGDRFIDTRAKALSAGRPIALDDASYAKLTKAPRDYSLVVLLTVVGERFACVICKQFQPEWNLLGKSWINGDKDGQSRLLFATLDFVDGKNTFKSVCLKSFFILKISNGKCGTMLTAYRS